MNIKTILKVIALFCGIGVAACCGLLYVYAPEEPFVSNGVTYWTVMPDGTQVYIKACAQEDCLAPNFKLPSVDGQEIELYGLRGSNVVLTFWATWCPYCRQENVELQKIHQKYKDQGLLVVAINEEESRSKVVEYTGREGLDFTFLLDEHLQAGRDYQAASLPRTFFIDPQSVIRKVHIGGMTYDEINAAIAAYLSAGPADAGQTVAAEVTPTTTVAPAMFSPSVPTVFSPSETPVIVLEGCVTADSLRVRSGPGTSYAIHARLGQGDCRFFDARSAAGDWLRISADHLGPTGERLWVAAQFIALKGDAWMLPAAEP